MTDLSVADKNPSADEALNARELNRMYREFYGPGENKYAIYPGFWSKKWGPAPMLGIVYADNEFLAERLASDRGINPSPAIPPRIKLLGAAKRVNSLIQ